jgi:mycothiol synthase
MGKVHSSKPYKNNNYIRCLVKTQVLMELNLSEFINSNELIKVSKNYSIKQYSKSLEKSWIKLLGMGEFNGVWNENTFQEFMTPIDRQKGSRLIVEENNVVASTFASSSIYENKEVGRLDFVVTHPMHRKKGLGKSVCISVINHFIEKNYKKVILQTEDWRVSAISIYLKLGFRPVYSDNNMKKRWQEIISTHFNDFKIKSINPEK